tara:strand:- start:158 stop:445 length:288 start_codon:yes stop_codon:yes gene_type:complete
MLPFGGAHAAPLIAVGNLAQPHWKYMETDIAFEFYFYFVIATTQLGILGIDQVPDFRISIGCIVGNAQSIFLHTVVSIKFTRENYKFSSYWSFWF